MNLDLFKILSLKKIVKKFNFDLETPKVGEIASVGIILDYSKFQDISEIKNEFVSQGISPNQIKILVLGTDKLVIDDSGVSVFTKKQVSSSGELNSDTLKEFTSIDFDLLVNYYDNHSVYLKIVSLKSKAKLRVGVNSDSKKMNHIMISSELSEYNIFIKELFKYIKLLHKV